MGNPPALPPRSSGLRACRAAVVALATVALAAARAAHASASSGTLHAAPDCSGPGGAVACRLNGLLHFLHVTAAVLGVVLLIVIGVAIRVYRQNSREAGKRRT